MAIQLLVGEKRLDRIVQSMIELNNGRANNVITVTLRPSFTTTVVPFINCSSACVPLYSPLTANAALEIGNGTMFISAIANASFTITHANNAQADRTFRFACVGG